jgi:hypothetical protein
MLVEVAISVNPRDLIYDKVEDELYNRLRKELIGWKVDYINDLIDDTREGNKIIIDAYITRKATEIKLENLDWHIREIVKEVRANMNKIIEGHFSPDVAKNATPAANIPPTSTPAATR